MEGTDMMGSGAQAPLHGGTVFAECASQNENPPRSGSTGNYDQSWTPWQEFLYLSSSSHDNCPRAEVHRTGQESDIDSVSK